MPERPAVKICGLTRGEDAHHADASGADYLGVVLSDGFARSVDTTRAARFLEGTRATRVAVLVNEPPDRAAVLATEIGAGVIQLHGDEDRAVVEALRGLGEWELWKAVRARSTGDMRRAAEEVGAVIDGLLVEGWREGVIGGGGASLGLAPEEVRPLVPASTTFVLAGGLTPSTVGATIQDFRPDVVDVSSGVERELGAKDPDLVEAFVAAARGTPLATP